METNPYAPPTAPVADVASARLRPRSVIVMILLSLVSFGLYYPIWFLRRRAAFNQLDSPRKLPRWPFFVALAWFASGNRITVSDEQPFKDYFAELAKVPKLQETAQKYVQPTSEFELAFWMEMILEALHQSLRLAREDLDSTITFHELMKLNVLRTVK